MFVLNMIWNSDFLVLRLHRTQQQKITKQLMARKLVRYTKLQIKMKIKKNEVKIIQK